MIMARIDWTEEEVGRVADEFIALRKKDVISHPVTLLLEAQKVLPEHRHRKATSGVTAFKRVVEVINLHWAEFVQRAAAAETSPSAATVPSEAPVAPAAPPTLAGADAVLTIEIRADPPSLPVLLADCPTPLLFGYALERLLQLGHTAPAFIAAVPGSHTTTQSTSTTAGSITAADSTAGAVKPVPAEQLRVAGDKPIHVGGGLAAAKRHEVVVVGLLHDMIKIVQDQLPRFSNLKVRLVDPREARTLPSALPCDFLLLTHSVLSKFQTEQIRRRLEHARSRILHFEGSISSLLEHLAKLDHPVK